MPTNKKDRTKRPKPEPGTLIPQPHGGALLAGAPHPDRQVPGPGRPPSEIRARLRGSFEERIRILEEIAENPGSSDSDRIKAIDMLAKYGLGTTQEVSGPDGAPIPTEIVVTRKLVDGDA